MYHTLHIYVLQYRNAIVYLDIPLQIGHPHTATRECMAPVAKLVESCTKYKSGNRSTSGVYWGRNVLKNDLGYATKPHQSLHGIILGSQGSIIRISTPSFRALYHDAKPHNLSI